MPRSDEGPFLREERALINAVAERLGKAAEKMRAEEKLREAHLEPEHFDADEWAGYPVAPDGHSVDTTPLMGWIDITLGDWVWSYSLSKYVYLPESNVSPTSAWVWIPK